MRTWLVLIAFVLRVGLPDMPLQGAVITFVNISLILGLIFAITMDAMEFSAKMTFHEKSGG